MLVTRKSIYSGIERTLDLNVTEEQMSWYEKGMHMQFAFPFLSAEDREFIKSGIPQSEWEEMFGDSDKEDDDERPEMSHEEQVENDMLCAKNAASFGMLIILIHP